MSENVQLLGNMNVCTELNDSEAKIYFNVRGSVTSTAIKGHRTIVQLVCTKIQLDTHEHMSVEELLQVLIQHLHIIQYCASV